MPNWSTIPFIYLTIDVKCFEINKLYELIINRFQGLNRIICTSLSRNTVNHRIDEFYNLFNDVHTVRYSSTSSEAIYKKKFIIRNNRFEMRKIQRYERQFTVKL